MSTVGAGLLMWFAISLVVVPFMGYRLRRKKETDEADQMVARRLYRPNTEQVVWVVLVDDDIYHVVHVCKDTDGELKVRSQEMSAESVEAMLANGWKWV